LRGNSVVGLKRSLIGTGEDKGDGQSREGLMGEKCRLTFVPEVGLIAGGATKPKKAAVLVVFVES